MTSRQTTPTSHEDAKLLGAHPRPGAVFLHVSWDFKAPARPGDAITGQVVEVRHDKPIT